MKRLLPLLRSTLPSAVHVQILTDRTTTIRGSVEDVQFELMLAVVLVVMVIFLFLRNLSATVIPSVAVPLSLVGTFGVMYLLGFSLNNLSLMALTISTGFVVDDAIVMIENVARYIEQGDSPLQAALKGSEQIAFTIMSLTISLIAVLIPLLFMGDVVGRLFREFAVTLGVTILISAVVSLTLTPMMCARLLHHTPEEEQGRFYRRSGQAFDRIISVLWKNAALGARQADGYTAGGGGDPGVHHIPVYHRAQRFLPGPGYRRNSGHLRSAAMDLFSGNGRKAAGPCQSNSSRPGGRKPIYVHWNRRDQYHAELRQGPDKPETAGRAAYKRRAR